MAVIAEVVINAPERAKAIHISIRGKTPSGKNAVQITRTGRRYPNERFSKWKADAMRQIDRKWLAPVFPDGPLTVNISYTPGDLIRRDAPGIVDALFHVLEAAQVVADDAQFKNVVFKTMPLNREAPGVEIYIIEGMA